MLNFRLARPRVLVDLNRVAALDAARRSMPTATLVGSARLARQRALERARSCARAGRCSREAMRSDRRTSRSATRGTIGGSLCPRRSRRRVAGAVPRLRRELELRAPARHGRWPRATSSAACFTTALGRRRAADRRSRFPAGRAAAGHGLPRARAAARRLRLVGACRAARRRPASGTCRRRAPGRVRRGRRPGWPAPPPAVLARRRPRRDAMRDAAELAAEIEARGDPHATRGLPARELAGARSRRVRSRRLARASG